MNRKYIFFFVACIFLITAINGVSAADNSNITAEVNYQYSDDLITPTFVIKNTNDAMVNFTSNKIANKYILTVDNSNVTDYSVEVSAPGYISQIQKIISNSSLMFNMVATENYQLGKEVTIAADKLLDFDTADDVLIITTAGVPKINGKTSEDCINGILSETGNTVTLGKGNLLMLRQTAVDPVNFAFIVKKGNALTVAVFNNCSKTPCYVGTISDKMTRSEWNKFVTAVGSEDAFSYASLANGWVAGVSKDVLQEAAFHGHICDGTLGGYTFVQTLLTYYPPRQETQGGSGSPGDVTSYKIIGVPGDSDDDAVLFFLDGTPGKSAYVGFDTTATGATKDMIAFIRWADSVVAYNPATNSYEIKTPGSGTLILMSFNSAKNKEAFKKETGIDPNAGSLEELQYQDWWISKLYTNPGELVTILYELDNLTEEQYYYFIGSASNITYPNNVKNATNAGEVRIEAAPAHGLDYAYIQELAKTLPKAERENNAMNTGDLTYDQIKEIGYNSSTMAKDIFKDELGIEIGKDNPNFGVFTSAGYVYLNGSTTEAAKDGIADVFGSTLSRKTLLPIHIAVWKPLWFTYVLRDGGNLWTVFIRYNPDGTYYIGNVDGSHVANINIDDGLNNATMVKKLSTTFIPDNWFNIQSIVNAWNGEPEFDQLITFLFHDHACPGVQPGFFITDYIQENYPLNDSESYSYMGSSIYCKDDSLLYLLGVSPGMESYFNQRLPGDETESTYEDGATEEGVLVIWDKNLNIGRAVIINFKWATIDTSAYSTSEAKRAAQIQAYIDMYAGRENPNVKDPVSVKATAETWITADQYKKLMSGGDDNNALSYVESLKGQTKDYVLSLLNNNGNNNNPQTQVNGTTNNPQQSSGSSSSQIQSSGSNNNGLSSYSSVGLDAASAAADNGENGEDASEGKAHEISKKTPATKKSSDNIALAIALVFIVAIICGIGYVRHKSKN